MRIQCGKSLTSYYYYDKIILILLYVIPFLYSITILFHKSYGSNLKHMQEFIYISGVFFDSLISFLQLYSLDRECLKSGAEHEPNRGFCLSECSIKSMKIWLLNKYFKYNLHPVYTVKQTISKKTKCVLFSASEILSLSGRVSNNIVYRELNAKRRCADGQGNKS